VENIDFHIEKMTGNRFWNVVGIISTLELRLTSDMKPGLVLNFPSKAEA